MSELISKGTDLSPRWATLDEQTKKIIEERDLLLAFVRDVRKRGCNIIGEQCIPCDALELLRKIGKENDK